MSRPDRERERCASVMTYMRRHADPMTDWTEFQQQAADTGPGVGADVSAVLVACRFMDHPVPLGPAWSDFGSVVAASWFHLAGGTAEDYPVHVGDVHVVPMGRERFREFFARHALDIDVAKVEVIGVIGVVGGEPMDLRVVLDEFLGDEFLGLEGT